MFGLVWGSALGLMCLVVCLGASVFAADHQARVFVSLSAFVALLEVLVLSVLLVGSVGVRV